MLFGQIFRPDFRNWLQSFAAAARTAQCFAAVECKSGSLTARLPARQTALAESLSFQKSSQQREQSPFYPTNKIKIHEILTCAEAPPPTAGRLTRVSDKSQSEIRNMSREESTWLHVNTAYMLTHARGPSEHPSVKHQNLQTQTSSFICPQNTSSIQIQPFFSPWRPPTSSFTDQWRPADSHFKDRLGEERSGQAGKEHKCEECGHVQRFHPLQ